MARLDSVGLAKQSVLGTKTTTMEYFPDVTSAEVTYNRETLETESTTGTRFPQGIEYGSAV